MNNQENIYLLISGRLGNQLFQYAYCRYWALKNNKKLNISFEALKQRGAAEDGWEDSLRFFNTKYTVSHERHPILCHGKLSQKIKYITCIILNKMKFIDFGKDYEELTKFEKKIADSLYKSNLYIYPSGRYLIESIKDEKKPVFIQGKFEFPDYADKIRNNLLTEYTPKITPAKNAEDLALLAGSTSSICISIRRGDFLSDQFKDTFFIADEEYFKSAIQVISEKIKDPTFFIFSDDIEWSKKWWKEEFGSQYKVYFEKGNNNLADKLYMMSSCKHFIISNSTFSWWAQWLSKNKDKLVISPAKWNKTSENKQILIDDTWIKIGSEILE